MGEMLEAKALSQIAAVFGQEMATDFPVIENPLAWQAKLDSQDAPLNMRGSGRFWNTVEARGLKVLYRNGSPEFTEIVFDLGRGIGLRLWTEDHDADGGGLADNIEFKFVDTAEYLKTQV